LDKNFTAQNANIALGWKEVVAIAQLEVFKTPIICKQQWSNLIKVYKKINDSKSGDGTGEEAPKGKDKSWEFYEILHQFASDKHNYNPLLLMSTASPQSPVVSEYQEEYIDDSEEEATGGYASIANFNIPETVEKILIDDSAASASTSSPAGHQKRNASQKTRKEQQIAEMLRQEKKSAKKFDALVGVFGQVVQKKYPDIDVSQLLNIGSDSESE
jgi:hypothetical protein